MVNLLYGARFSLTNYFKKVDKTNHLTVEVMYIHVERYTPQGEYPHYVGVAKSLHIRLREAVFCNLLLERLSLKSSR